MFQDITMMLQRIGLKRKDATIYLVCLHFKGGLFVHEIVEQSKLKRSTVDVALKRLIEQGYMNKIKIGNRFKYIAQSPETILFRQEETIEDFRSVLPILSKLGAEKGETDIRFFEGKEDIEKIYEHILLKLKFSDGKGRELLSFSSGTDMLKVYPNMQKRFIDKRIRMGVWYKAIIPHSSMRNNEYSTNDKELRLIKAVNDTQFPFTVTFDIYDDSVMIYSPQKPYGGVIMGNQKIAESMRSLFYLVWNLLPDSPS